MTAPGEQYTPRPLRVVIVAPSMNRLLGGQEVQGDQLLRAWRGDPDVEVELVESNPALPAWLRAVDAVPGLRTMLRLPTRTAALWRSVRAADVVHVFAGSHTSFLVGSVPALALARMLGKASVVHYHSGRGEEHLSRSGLARALLRHGAANVVPSAYLRDAFARCGVSARVIPNVVDTERFTLRDAEPRACRLVCTRNLERWYAVDDVIRVFAIVKRSMPSAQLVIAGRGREERALRALVEQLRLADVCFAGSISRDAMPDLLKSASVMLNASRIDNMPMSILEAFAVGVPVVTSSVGGIRTIARHNDTALLADCGDVEQMALHTLSILDNPALAQRLTQAARHEADRCTWTAVRPLWHALYRRVAPRRASSAS